MTYLAGISQSLGSRFNEKAAERHMGFCAEKNKRIPDKKTIDPAAQRRMQARVNVSIKFYRILPMIWFGQIPPSIICDTFSSRESKVERVQRRMSCLTAMAITTVSITAVEVRLTLIRFNKLPSACKRSSSDLCWTLLQTITDPILEYMALP